MERVGTISQLMGRGARRAERLLPVMRQWAEDHNEPPMSLHTVQEDMKRSRILAVEGAQASAQDVEESMWLIVEESWKRASDRTLPAGSEVKQKYLDLAEKAAADISKHRHQGIEAAVSERAVKAYEQMADAFVAVVYQVLDQLDLPSAEIERGKALFHEQLILVAGNQGLIAAPDSVN